MSELSVDHLLGIKYLKEDDLHLIFETADHFKEVINRKIKKVPTLRDVTIANLFLPLRKVILPWMDLSSGITRS